MVRIPLVLAASLLLFPLIAGAEEPPVPAVSSFELAGRIDYEEGTLAATEVLSIENRTGRPLTHIPLNLNRLMRYTRAADAEGTLAIVQEVVTFEDRPMLQVNHAVIELRKPLAPAALTTITIDYRGHLTGYPETGSLYIRDSIDETFTILRADAYAFPVVGTLSAAANRSIPPASFAFDVRLTVPSTHRVATGGRLLESTSKGGETTYHFRSDGPVPFVNIAIARYELIERNGIRIYHFAGDAEGAARVASKSEAAVRLLTRWFGPLQRDPEFTIIEIPDDMGSQADLNAGIIQTASAFRSAGAMQELYHELSHFWSVQDTDVPSPRWNEGLAMYLQRRVAASIDQHDETADRAAKTAARLVKIALQDPRLAAIPFDRYGRERMTDFSYGTGFLMFYALEKQIGEEPLHRALRDYYQHYKSSGAGFAEFAATCSRVSGRNLAPFFDAWFSTTGWLSKLQANEPVETIGSGTAR